MDDLSEKLAYWRHNGAPGRLARKGTTDIRVIRRDDDGGVAGFNRHHWDDRVDAVATPRHHHIKTRSTDE